MSNVTKILWSTSAWAFILRGLTAISALMINILIVRVMGPEEVGAYFLVFSMASMLTLLGSFGLHIAAVKLIAEAMSKGLPGRAKEAVLKVLTLGVLSCLILSVIIYSGGLTQINAWLYQSEHLAQSTLIVTCWVFFWTMQINYAEIFRGFNDIKLAMIFRRLVPNVIFIILLSFFFITRQNIYFRTVLLSALGAWIASTFLSMLIAGRKIKSLSGKEGVSYLEILKLSWPLGVTTLFSFGLTQADIWIIGCLEQFDYLAAYGAASRLVHFVVFPLMIINATMPPLIARLYSRGQMEELETILRGTSTIAAVFGLTILAGTLIFGREILVLIYGEFYGTGAIILKILMFGLLFRFIGGASHFALMMVGQEKTTMIVSFLAAVLMISGAIYFGRAYGAIGVACSVTVSTIFRNLTYLYFVKSKVGIWSLPKMDFVAIKDMIKQRRIKS